MKKILFGLVFLLSCTLIQSAWAQSATDIFHSSAQTYIGGDANKAISQLKAGLQKYPNDAKMKALLEKLEKEKEEKEQQQKQQEQQQQQDQNKEQQDSAQDKQQDQKNGEQQKQQDQQQQNQNKDNQGQDKQDDQKQNPSGQDQKPGDPDKNNQKNEPAGQPEKSPEQQQRELSQQELIDKLKEMNISKEKAEAILNALNNNEIKFIQQQKKKATKRPPNGKPDW